jgi:hypothetical protein
MVAGRGALWARFMLLDICVSAHTILIDGFAAKLVEYHVPSY